jgi:GAF domain-containing protein
VICERDLKPVEDALSWARQFSRIAAELNQVRGTSAVLSRIAQLATGVADCPWAAIARVTDERPIVAAASDPAAAELIAQIQATAGGGPTWHAAADGEEVHVADLAEDPRWPEHFKQLLAGTPVRAIVALPLELGEHSLGVLTLYADRPHAFTLEALAAARVYADHAALALDADRTEVRAENLEIALQSSREIGIAIGILVERHKLGAEQAFDMLRAASQHTARKLRDIACDLVRTGDFDFAVSTVQRPMDPRNLSLADGFGVEQPVPPAVTTDPAGT